MLRFPPIDAGLEVVTGAFSVIGTCDEFTSPATNLDSMAILKH